MSDDDSSNPTHTRNRRYGVRNPQLFCVGANVTENWKLFKQRWDMYALLSKLQAEDTRIQVATLLQYLGDDALKVYNGFQFDTSESERTVKEIIDKFDQFAIGEINVTYERFMFNTRNQQEGETFDKFYSELQTLVKTCDYCNTCRSSLLKDRIVIGINDSSVRTDLLKIRNLTLDKCIDTCRAAERPLQRPSLRSLSIILPDMASLMYW